jgi:hypothetical protein
MVEVTDVEEHGEAELLVEGVLPMEGVAAALAVELTPPMKEGVALPDAVLAMPVDDTRTLVVTETVEEMETVA